MKSIYTLTLNFIILSFIGIHALGKNYLSTDTNGNTEQNTYPAVYKNDSLELIKLYKSTYGAQWENPWDFD